MAMSKKEQQAVRNILLRDGTVRASSAPSAVRAENKVVSQQNAIAARRNEMRPTGRTVG